MQASHCLILCDTWDLEEGFEDYPKYIMPGEDVNKIASNYTFPHGIERLVAVFDLSIDIDQQLNTVSLNQPALGYKE